MTEQEVLRRLLGLEARMARMENGVQVDQNIVRIGGNLEVKGAIQSGTPNIAPFLGLPELRGIWGFGSINEGGNALDMSGQGRTLTNVGAAVRGALANGTPYAITNSTDYFTRTTEVGLEITGAMTLIGWYWFDSIVPSTHYSIAGKMGGSANRAYALSAFDASNRIVASISSNGTAEACSARLPYYTSGKFTFLAMRFIPNTEVALFVNDEKAVNTSGAPPASIYNTSGFFSIGAHAGAGAGAGRVSTWALYAAAHTDDVIRNILFQSAGAFGY